jgi:hypothetical protein
MKPTKGPLTRQHAARNYSRIATILAADIAEAAMKPGERPTAALLLAEG